MRLSDNSYKIISLVDDRELDVDDFGAGGGGTITGIVQPKDFTFMIFTAHTT